MTLAPGEPLPDIALISPDGEPVRPSDFAGKKLVLFFYPKDDTPGCTTENKDFSTLADRFAASGTVLLGISKRGDIYLRMLLIHGARAVIRFVEGKQDKTSEWTQRLLARRNKNVAAVALANKNARTVWALLTKESKFRPDYTAVQPTAA